MGWVIRKGLNFMIRCMFFFFAFHRSGLTSDDVNLCPAYIMGSLTQCAITILQDW